ncbi:histidinol-phosphatase [Haliscomenobacter sp.]|uniref:histidinol-phosphatase n=1 Tax=Haliscomenobacter sp. TaxID=2717303 RepID=UPI0033651428
MKKILLLSILLCIISPLCAQKWYKGNLHTHSLWSDGDDYPEMIMAWYKEHGYNFVALSDHNTLQDGQRWQWLPKAPQRRRAFNKYLEKYGPAWVNFEKKGNDSLHVRLKTLKEYAPLFQEPGRFLIVQSEEISSQYKGKPIHLNATNIKGVVLTQFGNSVTEVMQSNINAVMAQRRLTGQPMFPHINHPNFQFAISPADMMGLQYERFFEVYNGHPAAVNYGDKTHVSMETLWDEINLHYVQIGQPLLYGLATDDSHDYFNFGANYCNTGRGWVMVKTDSLHGGAIVEAMEAGQFYATTGVELDQLTQSSKAISFHLKTERGITYQIQFIGVLKGKKNAEVLKEINLKAKDDANISYTLTGNEWFVRAKIVSSKNKENPYQVGDKETAWTQPVAPFALPEIAPVSPLRNAHAHNDYEHNRPLFDALKEGFTSVEADVFLMNDSLYVAHNRPYFRSPARTLEQMYLRPLRAHIQKMGGKVYPDFFAPFYLFIDIKVNGEASYRALEKLFAKYSDILKMCTDGNCNEAPVQVVLSGDRPIETLRKQSQRLASLDGRPNDLGKNITPNLMPIISDDYHNHFKWRGSGEMPADEKQKLDEMLKRVHDEGKKLRFWASPDNENVWKVLQTAGVDLINTDRLEELRVFLTAKN